VGPGRRLDIGRDDLHSSFEPITHDILAGNPGKTWLDLHERHTGFAYPSGDAQANHPNTCADVEHALRSRSVGGNGCRQQHGVDARPMAADGLQDHESTAEEGVFAHLESKLARFRPRHRQ
jgi:hypothetical protein